MDKDLIYVATALICTQIWGASVIESKSFRSLMQFLWFVIFVAILIFN